MKIVRSEPMRRHHFLDMRIGFFDRFLIKGEREKPDFNRRMFNEDFARLFHFMTRRSGNPFQVLSNDDELTRRLLGNVKTRYARHRADETIRELVEEIAQSLIWFGTAYYFLHDDPEHGDVHVASFSSTGVVRLFGTHIQLVPKRTKRHWNRDDEEIPREIRILDSAKVMRFEMPRTVKRLLSAQNRTLTVLDQHQFGVTDFQPQLTHENPNPTNHFDFRVWRDTQEHALYRATRGTGWDGRKSDSPKRSDFFICYRLIRFRRNQLMLRDDILRQLSAELSRVGRGYNADYAVEVSGTEELPRVEHLDDLEAKLSREEVGFAEVIDYCYKR